MINLSKLIDFDKKKAILYIVSLESAVNDHLVGNTEIVIFFGRLLAESANYSLQSNIDQNKEAGPQGPSPTDPPLSLAY